VKIDWWIFGGFGGALLFGFAFWGTLAWLILR
jgi:hypothetical protein